MLIAIVVVLVLLLLFFIAQKSGREEESEEQKVFKATQKFPTQYLTGHPLLTQPEYVYLVKNDKDITLVERKLYTNTPSYESLATIPLSAITAIETKDHTSIEKKFSLGKFMVLGTYSLAFPKKEVKETGYLLIHWKLNDSAFTAVFKNEDKGALQAVATARHVLQQWAKPS